MMRKGVTETQFRNKDFKLDKARGHEHTPEGSKDVIRIIRKDPSQLKNFTNYRPETTPTGMDPAKPGTPATPERKKLEEEFVKHMRREYGDRLYWNDGFVIDNAEHMSYQSLIIGITTSGHALEDLSEIQREDAKVRKLTRAWIIGPKGKKLNPFWYK